ncbi:MAG: Glu-tRNA(Gln) amidotransferase subunit GatD [Nanoarchaeota archaeon]|nr:Glu-tRNA(Gln) amidotransferase subunit GatD [Nanoarchaeota archaeon]MBU1269547.1 Glu-tRNA(Gln) amidotransferase subunit GatD [Nanoarchaeota archaeon]MBU1604721.1 Glu-tRNA(Gln) amidotransferase subunit GatD [Nanoarchaeota archaeon]MBU2443808.1 Glu-tRNA(Gln) amidotransferase subunit GatD [Nanoarchaeota archaeon]
MIGAGDKIRVFYKDKIFEGILMSQEKPDFLDIKLSSGYNVGLKKKSITKTELLKKKSELKVPPEKNVVKKNLPTMSILHTGGTIASKVDYSTGAVIAQFTEGELLSMFPEIKNLANINSRLIRNMQSEMMRFSHYNLLAKAIAEEAKKGVDGVILTHGTDTMHYTAAALSFALENLTIPVILVGSQRSSDRGSTDAAMNLLAAVQFITNTDFAGVAMCMHENNDDKNCLILPGCKSRKMHTSRRDAFRPINTTAIARIDVESKKITLISEYDKKDKNKKISLKLFDEKLKVGLIKAHVNMFASEFLAYKDFDGLVVEIMGIGHIPTMKVDEFTSENEKILNAINTLSKKVVVAAAPQTIYGRVDMDVYTPGKQLLKAGVIGNHTDMTPETAFIKLAWLLSNHKNEARKLFGKNLRGEISERSEKGAYLV